MALRPRSQVASRSPLSATPLTGSEITSAIVPVTKIEAMNPSAPPIVRRWFVVASAQSPITASTASGTTHNSGMGAMSVDKSTIGALWADAKGKEVLQKDVPGIEQYMDQIKDMTLAQVAPMSQGAIDDAKLKDIQAKFDAINSGK